MNCVVGVYSNKNDLSNSTVVHQVFEGHPGRQLFEPPVTRLCCCIIHRYHRYGPTSLRTKGRNQIPGHRRWALSHWNRFVQRSAENPPRWTRVPWWHSNHARPRSRDQVAEKAVNLDLMASRLDGYAAVTDAPASGLVPELLELYPDAKVICTVRDPKSWKKSMEGVANAATLWFLRFVLFPLPALRHFVDYINVLRAAWIHLYGEREPLTTQTYDRRIAWLKRVVPKDRLIFFDVKDGWEPLCKALDKKVPDGVPFPRINDGEAIDAFAKKHLQRGLTRWAVIIAAGVAVVAAVIVLV